MTSFIRCDTHLAYRINQPASLFAKFHFRYACSVAAVPFKVLYTDYDHVAVTYACAAWNDDGTCRRPGEQVNIMSRDKHLRPDARRAAYDALEQLTCIHVNDLVPAHMSREYQLLRVLSNSML